MSKCECSLCQLSRQLTPICEKLTKEEQKVIDILWSRMECAELDLDVKEAKEKGWWPVDEYEGTFEVGDWTI